MENDLLTYCQQQLSYGRCALVSLNGKRVLIAPTLTKNDFTYDVELAIGVEGNGFFIHKLGTPIDVFDLVSSGFPLHIAEVIAELVTAMLPSTNNQQQTSPKGQLVTGNSP
jgi:hypothetical protein